MLRKIIKIEEEKCDGCGQCVPECHEGALQIIDGKARLISDLFCDGLGACLGHCPTGALTIVEREAEPYDEKKVMDYIVKGGTNVIIAHLKHLRDHEEFEYLREALEYLRDNGIENPITVDDVEEKKTQCGCPGSREIAFEQTNVNDNEEGSRISHLRQWPIQLHLVSPHAQYFKNSDLLLVADCCGFAYPDFHKDFLKGKSLAIACPKLDSNKQVYLDKLITMIRESNLKSITVLIMQVPCCSGLAQLAFDAVNSTEIKIPINNIVLGINGEILKEEQIA
ncbi:MAG: 4Fe-4S ferredoxin [Ignavibacteriales bacterium]|nr:MAG: 4Fe-4S ferredoxin [Ignavibacteriales bacterium]